MCTLIKLKIQIFGRFLSNMIMPNISIFIAWGIMTTFFTPLGWMPNKNLQHLLLPMIMYVLPLLIGYTGAKLFAGDKGGLVGSMATLGVITSTSMPMILGAMIVGPLAGLSVKYFNKIIENNITNGFEMLINNFSIAIIGVIWVLISFFSIGPSVEWFSHYLGDIITLIVKYNLLPLVSIIIEPAKIFFLNNAINHGIFSPLGVQELIEKNSSIFFLIESNPGPGLGVLIAWFFFGTGNLSKTAGGAAIIEFFGGVHEIYFPYVLTYPKLIISLILGGMTGTFMLIFLHGGLISVVSPGSIISILAMTPKGLYISNMISIFLSFFVSFISSAVFLRMNILKDNNIKDKLGNKTNNVFETINEENSINLNIQSDKKIKNIIFACDAGMGSSAMGASILRKKIKEAKLFNISVSNTAINLLPSTVDLVITHQNLTKRAKMYALNSQHISLKNFLDYDFYDSLVKKLSDSNVDTKYNQCNLMDNKKTKTVESLNNLFLLNADNIFLNQYADNKETAIKFIGKHLVKQGYVKNEYINAMLEREKISSTWLGESIALPHGTIKAKDTILKTGIIFCQFPKGVQFGDDVDDIAKIVIGVAAKNNEHIMIVSNITNALDDKDIIKKLSTTINKEEVLSLLNFKL